MSKLQNFVKIMEKSETDKVLILTNHYQIKGRVYDCESCNEDGFVNLTNASLCVISEMYDNSCDSLVSQKYDWLHVNIDKITAFSFIH